MKTMSLVTAAERLCAACGSPNGGPHSEIELSEAENELGITLTPDYKRMLAKIGTFDCPRLPSVLASADRTLAALQTLIPVNRLSAINHDYWQAGMPRDLLAFGLTSTGDALCFATNGAPQVLYFDHDFGDARPVAQSLAELIRTYVSLVESA
jgi:hypothetical protein